MEKIAIITYNILSPNLAKLMINDDVYTSDIMEDKYRLYKIEKYLRHQIEKYLKYNLIICLQEVPEDWLIIFSQLFTSLKYKYINVQYGRVDNGNMGVLIAYPDYLNINKSEFFNVGQFIEINDDISRKASSKNNIAIFAIFENKNSNLKFGIITYHMPCVPSIPQIALLHSKTIYRHIKKFMNNINWIFAGDFNMTPDTIAYNYLVNTINLGCIWKDVLRHYPITNHAYISNFEFSGCIDYMFYNKGKINIKDTPIKYIGSNLICNKVKLNKLVNIIPDKYEPSDHIPIFSLFILLN
jgi:mRNA deadenylase 3'-5' endonuclease subunit Ccr4